MLHELGAVPVVADALDPDQVAEAVGRAKPDVIVHQLTAIGEVNPRHMERAKKPMRVPRFVGRLFAGEAGAVMPLGRSFSTDSSG
jgi:hypothetical protein